MVGSLSYETVKLVRHLKNQGISPLDLCDLITVVPVLRYTNYLLQPFGCLSAIFISLKSRHCCGEDGGDHVARSWQPATRTMFVRNPSYLPGHQQFLELDI